MSLSLSARDLQHLRTAQRVLLAPLQYDTPEAWQRDAARYVQTLAGADHAYAFMPAGEQMMIEGSDLDPAFFEDLRASFRGVQDGHFLLDDPMPLQMHLQRMRGGAGVYHELDLADRSTIERSPAHQTLFRPHGVEYATGLSVPLPVGEASICVAFESADAPGYDPDAGRALGLLVPAFEAGVEQWRRLAPVRSRFASLIDTLSDAVVIVDPDGTERHGNRAFRALLAAEPDAEALQGAVRTLADEARAGSEGLAAARHELTLPGGTYRLRAGRAPPDLFAGAGTLVVVERASPYPSPSVLREQFGLTPREVEVALLLAEGRSNDAIAEALVISSHTARHHVQKVLRKLGAASRSAVSHVLLH
jgi:DNA-binding CsgD family transcriptional regulator/PAS domain-containing protein